MKRRKIIKALAIVFAIVVGLIALGWFLQSQHVKKRIYAYMMDAEYVGYEGVIMQTKANNCGPSSLKMIFDRYNISSSLNEIEDGVKLSKKGSSMLALKEMAELKGLKAEGWNLTLEDLLRSTFPVILFVSGDHYVVADSVLNDTLYLRDPAIGKLKISADKLHHVWKGVTIAFNYR